MKSTLTKKILHRLASVCAVLFMVLAATGCSAGSTIDTTLIINEDLSGVRKMNITIDNSVYEEYFTANIEDFNALLTDACPEEIAWTYSDVDGVKKYDMEIAFSSPEDYKSKVESILGTEGIELTITATDTVWASGISVSESFSDKELLKWMEDLLVNNGFVSSSNASMIFSDGQVNVVYGEETFGTGSRIHVDNVEYVSVNAMHILTQIDGLGSYGRRVIVDIPASSMERKGEDIRAYMNGVVPEGAVGEWSEGENTTLFTVTASKLTVEQLDAFDKTFFDSDNCSVTAEEASTADTPFSFGENLKEHIDFSSYRASNSDNIYVAYAMKKPDSFYVYESGYEGREWSEYAGYYLYRDTYLYEPAMDFSTAIQKVYKVRDLSVVTDKTLGGKWKRTLTFALENAPTEEEQTVIAEVIKERAGLAEEEPAESEEAVAEEAETEEAETEEKSAADVKFSDKTSDGVYKVTITQKGSAEELRESSEMLFGMDSSVSYARDKGFWKIKKQEAFEERLSFGDLLDYVTDDFDINYTAKMGALSEQQYCSVDSAEMKNGKLSAVFSNNRVSITYVGSKLDLLAVLFWLFVAVAVVNIVILVLKLTVFAKKAEQKPCAEIEQKPEAAPEAEQEQKPETAPEAERKVPKFCEKCGTPRPEDAAFCEKCGSKFEN